MVVLQQPPIPKRHTKAKNAIRIATSSPPCTPAAVTTTLSRKVSEAVAYVVEKSAWWRRDTKKKISTAVAERGRTLGRSFNDLVLRHNAALGCTSHDVTASFVSPRDYEFSCTSSPPRRPRRRTRHVSATRGHHVAMLRHERCVLLRPVPVDWEDGAAAAVDEFHVDKAAEEFIERFYRELMMQKWTTATARDVYDHKFG